MFPLLLPTHHLKLSRCLHISRACSHLYTDSSPFDCSFSALSSRREADPRLWNSLLKKCIHDRDFDLAISAYSEMRKLGVQHDSYTLPLVNQAISMLGVDVPYIHMIHCVGVKTGFDSDVYFCNTLIEVFVKFGRTGLARKLFDRMPHRDIVSWTTVISGYSGEGNSTCAFQLFNDMTIEVEPNSVTMIIMLQACLDCPSAEQGKMVHGLLIKNGLVNDQSVRNSLLKLYADNIMALPLFVKNLFDEFMEPDTITCNILISFYNSNGDVTEVISAFSNMQQEIPPSAETLTIVVSALTKIGCCAKAEQLHCLCVKSGYSDHVLLTCLLGFYAKWDVDLDKSARLFEEIPYRNHITWGYMISGFIMQGDFPKTTDFIMKMQAAGLRHEPEILTSLLEAYTELGALQKGKEIHGYFLRNLGNDSPEIRLMLETSILNMYARCGSISYAVKCFSLMLDIDIVAWTAMIESLGTYGLGPEALNLFRQMLGEGIYPDSVTFLSLLSACAHSGLTTEGCQLFHAMKWEFHLEPELHHYTCMVDLLGRNGKLKEALSMVLKMPCCPDSRIWGALLAASTIYMDKKIADYAAERVSELEPDNVGYRVMLSNVQASAEIWGGAEIARRSMREMDLKKRTPGWSCIEIKEKIEGFVSRDRSHPFRDEIFDVLKLLGRQMQDMDMHSVDGIM